MKKALIVFAVASMVSGVMNVSNASAREANGWSGHGYSVLLDSKGGAEIETACGFISIKNWNDQGKSMEGEESSALPSPVKNFADVSVTAVRDEDGSLDLTIGNEAPITLQEGYEPAVICG
jgi:hypothetical protein